MSWHDLVDVVAREQLVVPPGVQARTSGASPRQIAMGRYPQLRLYRLGQDVPEASVGVASGMSSAELEELAGQVEQWAAELRLAARLVRPGARMREAG